MRKTPFSYSLIPSIFYYCCTAAGLYAFGTGQTNAPIIARHDKRGWLLQRKESVVPLVGTSPANSFIELAAGV